MRFRFPTAAIFFIVSVYGLTIDLDVTGAERPPNVLLILADDLGFSDLGCYGGEIQTPNLDQLAKEGAVFTQFYNTARCWPTRGALTTGYYAQQISRDVLPGIAGNGHGRRPTWAPLIAELLQPAGYRSYHSGKWHIDGGQLRGGFDRSYSLDDLDRLFHPKRHSRDEQRLPPVADDANYYATTFIADHAIECLKEHQSRFSDRPFLSYVAFSAPHFPLQAPPETIAKYADFYGAGWDAVREARYERQRKLLAMTSPLSALESNVGPPYDFPDAIAALTPGEVNREVAWKTLSDGERKFQATKMRIHAAMVDQMDQEIGRIIAQIRSMQALNDTLILFLSDNGASAEIMIRGDGHDPSAAPGSAKSYLCLGPGWSSCANTPFRRHKTWVHEGGIATPLIVHWPAKVQGGGLRTEVGHVIDIVPTLLEAAGLSPRSNHPSAPERPGRSLFETITRGTPIQRDYIWWLHEGNRALRVGDWKIVAAKDEPWELYDLSADRAETNNLANQMPQKVAELVSIWQAHTDASVALVESK